MEQVVNEKHKPKPEVPKLPPSFLMELCDSIKKEGGKEISIDEIESFVRTYMLKLQTNALIHAYQRGMNSGLRIAK